MIDIPTALSRAETRLLQRFAAGRRVVEAGALLGYSTVVLAEVAASVVSIDLHEGYGPSTWGAYLRNLDRYRVRHRVEVVKGDCMASLPRFAGDFAFIDLNGERATIERAICSTLAPIVALHDYNRPYCDGVADAIAHTNLEVIARVDSLVIGRKR